MTQSFVRTCTLLYETLFTVWGLDNGAKTCRLDNSTRQHTMCIYSKLPERKPLTGSYLSCLEVEPTLGLLLYVDPNFTWSKAIQSFTTLPKSWWIFKVRNIHTLISETFLGLDITAPRCLIVCRTVFASPLRPPSAMQPTGPWQLQAAWQLSGPRCYPLSSRVSMLQMVSHCPDLACHTFVPRVVQSRSTRNQWFHCWEVSWLGGINTVPPCALHS